MELPLEIPHDIFRPLVTTWTRKIEAAQRARSQWKEQADECRMFYNRSAAAMWNPEYTKKFWKGVEAPRFRITLNLAYEYVAVFAPYLMWDTPHRNVEPKRTLDLPPELLGGEESPLFAMYQQEAQRSKTQDETVAWLLQDWLNYLAGEMPGGGLMAHGELALLDSLLVGRGTQWTRPYKMEGSDRTLVGSFHEPPERLFIDPDFTNLRDARWIALQHIDHHWVLERKFGWPENSLKGRATLESSWQAATTDPANRVAGQSNDMVVWYEVWSKAGTGARDTDIHPAIKQNLERQVGDYAYLAFSPSVPSPLNCSSEYLRSGATTDDIKRKFSWPIPLWTDGRWPVECLDFYPNTDASDPGAAWPVAPLTPAMGEIKFLNFLIPWLANRVWSSSRDFWAVAGQHYEHYLKYLRDGLDQTVIPAPAMVDDVRKAITVLQQPETRADTWRIVDVVTDLFRRRTGLIDFAYGMNEGGTQDRTAEGVMAKREFVSARPEFMQKKVVSYHSQLGAKEAFVTRLFVTGHDVEPRYGRIGRMLWEQLIMSTDVELVVRQMNYSVAAASVRRANRDRDLANFGQAMQYWLGVMQSYAQMNNNWEPLNGLIEKWGELHDMNVEPLTMPPIEPDPMQQQMQQQQMQLDQAKLAADVQKSQADIEKAKLDLLAKQMDAEGKQQQGQVDIASKLMDLQIDQAKASQDLEQDQEKHEQDLFQDRQKFVQDFFQQKQLASVKLQQAKRPAPNGSAA